MLQIAHVAREVAILAPPILLAVTFHEVAHGYVADRLGDPTARLAGRLTLNPFAHLDLVGTLVFVVTRMIGWAKPVPVDPSRFRNPRRDMMWVGFAGPASNFLLAGILAVAHRLLVSCLDAGLAGGVVLPLALMAREGVIVNLGLGIFNLVPVPPLDGSRVLSGLLPAKMAGAVDRVERFGFALLLILVFSGVLDRTVFPALRLAAHTLLGS